jgi:hypothetical protein
LTEDAALISRHRFLASLLSTPALTHLSAGLTDFSAQPAASPTVVVAAALAVPRRSTDWNRAHMAHFCTPNKSFNENFF